MKSSSGLWGFFNFLPFFFLFNLELFFFLSFFFSLCSITNAIMASSLFTHWCLNNFPKLHIFAYFLIIKIFKIIIFLLDNLTDQMFITEDNTIQNLSWRHLRWPKSRSEYRVRVRIMPWALVPYITLTFLSWSKSTYTSICFNSRVES